MSAFINFPQGSGGTSLDGGTWSGAGAVVGPTPPSSPVTGTLWYDTTNAILNVFDGAVWQPAATGTAVEGTPAWDWSQGYFDPAGYSRIIPPNTDTIIPIATGAFPPGYHVSDGVTPGGVYPAPGAVSNGTLPIRLAPTPSGVGRLKFFTYCKVIFTNPSPTATASFVCALGTSSSSTQVAGTPMWPYLGVAHDLGVFQEHPFTLGPGMDLEVVMTRLDILDQAFIGNAPVPTWPYWTMALAGDGSLLYPAVGPEYYEFSNIGLVIQGIHSYGYSC